MVLYYLGEFNVQQNRENIQYVVTLYLFALKIKSLLIDKCMVVKFTSLVRVNMKKTRTSRSLSGPDIVFKNYGRN